VVYLIADVVLLVCILVMLRHLFHLVDNSPWPFLLSVGLFFFFTSFSMFLHFYSFSGKLVFICFCFVLLVLFF
jgi:hypothetical protein